MIPNTISLLRQCIASNNPVTRSVIKGIIAERMNCSPKFIQTVYLIGYGER